MLVTLHEVLSADELSTVRERLEAAEWRDGKETAGWAAKHVKSNDQATGPELQDTRQIVRNALFRNELFMKAAFIKRHSKIMFSRYRSEQNYGLHVDDPLMGATPEILRSDLSVTLFLSDSSSYEGGELVISPMGIERSVKLAAGDAILYPTSSLHRVTPVVKGERLAAVLWIQSTVRDVGERQILFDLSSASREIFEKDGKTALFDLISNSYSNLLRKWADC
jgi:PKHD-type hydroxylase